MTTSTPATRTALAATATAALLLLAPGTAAAVILDGMNQCTVKLSDGTDVVLYGEYVSKMGGGAGQSCKSSGPLRVMRARSVGEDAGDLEEEVMEHAASQGLPTVERYRARGFEDTPPLVAPRRSDGGSERWWNPNRTRRDRASVGKTEGQNTQDFIRNQAMNASQAYDRVRDGGFRKHKKSPCYYYLPPGNSLRLSKREDGNPEFLFVKYTTDETEAEGGVQGGLLHFLMEWRLSTDQESELRKKVKSDCRADGKPGKLMGHVELNEAEEKGSFRIISATLSDEGFTRSMVQSGHAPTMPGGKVAAAANMSSQGAALFLSTLENKSSIADLSVELDFNYAVQLPAAKGEIIFHWDRVQIAAESFEAEYYSSNDERGKGDDDDDLTITEDEAHAFFDYMVENSVVEFVFEGYNPDSEYTGKVMEAMMQYFLNSMMEPAGDTSMMSLPDDDDDDPDSSQAKKEEVLGQGGEVLYQVNKTKWKESYAQKKQVIRMDAGLAVRRRFQVVGNMASWYNSVRGKRCCIQSVNLSDPFFQQREIRFILDQDAVDIFGEMVNYVTVNVKKRRNRGKEFNASATIDAEHLDKKGIVASITYAREEDRNSELYEYQTQWSVRGGNLFPSRPRWLRGNWEGVTLAPPIEEWFVEAEGDLAQMAENDIARVTVELHYPLFGKEEYTVLPLSPRVGEDLVGQKIYVDRGTRGFAYRLIIHHKTEGRMVLPWQTRIGDRYVYATIPDEVLVAGQPRQQALMAAQSLGKLGAEKVLDKFQELFSKAD